MSVRILIGDCRERLRELADASVDACVTDPPYEIGFMGKNWDRRGVAFDPATWRAVLRVLKPGAHLLAFGGTRTYHRMVCAIEDVGFEIRDQIGWLYGQGFPKSHNLDGDWDGWGTALKPAWEPIVVARKPFRGTVAANVAAHGCGALNIDGCRVVGEKGNGVWGSSNAGVDRQRMFNASPDMGEYRSAAVAIDEGKVGRWPANVIHDGSDEVLAAFPDAPGQRGALNGDEPSSKTNGIFGKFNGRVPSSPRADSGSAARFFYCAKANRADRDAGLESFEKKPLHWSSGDQNPGTFQSPGTDKSARNYHPTVKPTDLMRYLCRLVTPTGGVVLDPFMGSGSTGKGAVLDGFDFIGIELEVAYAAIAEARTAHAQRERESTPAIQQGDLFGVPA